MDIDYNVLADKKVLIVDDDPDILTTLVAAFEPTGALIETTNNGNRAVEIAEKHGPDLIILDMMLPGKSGFLVLERLKGKKMPSEKPFILMITGNEGQRHKMFAQALGVNEYFQKPVRVEKLLDRAAELLGEWDRDHPEEAAAATAPASDEE